MHLYGHASIFLCSSSKFFSCFTIKSERAWMLAQEKTCSFFLSINEAKGHHHNHFYNHQHRRACAKFFFSWSSQLNWKRRKKGPTKRIFHTNTPFPQINKSKATICCFILVIIFIIYKTIFSLHHFFPFNSFLWYELLLRSLMDTYLNLIPFFSHSLFISFNFHLLMMIFFFFFFIKA